MRESNPNLFFNRGVNKFWYVTFGAKTLIQDMVSTITNNNNKMSEIIDIVVDGNPIVFPDELEGVVRSKKVDVLIQRWFLIFQVMLEE